VHRLEGASFSDEKGDRMSEDAHEELEPLFPPNPIVEELEQRRAQQQAMRDPHRSLDLDAHVQAMLSDQGHEGMALSLDLRELLHVVKRHN
jgi:hypothetical protein